MKHILKILLLFLSLSFIFASCKKEKTSNNATDQLPPATQTGANTFGCLVNGKAWIPKGYDGTGRPNPRILYDQGLNGRPHLNIDTKQFTNTQSTGNISISFGNLDHSGEYSSPTEFDFYCGWTPVLGNCGTLAYDTTIKRWGKGQITKLDIPNQIISGTFDCKFKTLQCDTVFITDGRFDIKF